MAEYHLPDVGEGLIEAEIVTWMVQVGDVVKVNDVVVEIETAKSLVELPSPYAGTVRAIHVAEGETVPVGTPIVSIGEPAAESAFAPAVGPSAGPDADPDVVLEAVPDAGPDLAFDPSNPAAAGGENQTLVGYGPRAAASQRRARRATFAAPEKPLEPVVAPFVSVPATALTPATAFHSPRPAAVDRGPGRLRALAKPPVRKLAKDLGVDLLSLAPSGPDGTVTRGDVTAAAHATGAAHVNGAAQPIGATQPTDETHATAEDQAGRAAADGARERREPVRGVRKMMAQAMVESAFTAPHVTEWLTLDVTRTMRFLERLRGHRDFRDVKVSPLLVVAKAVCLAARRTPELNAAWDQTSGEVLFKSYVNLGIAAATPRGLVVPNIKDAETLSLAGLATAINELARTARDGRTQPAQMAGGSFTITNVGMFGIDAGTPIINPGEAAILCVGAVRKQPWVVSKAGRDKIKPRDVLTLALSFDHRLVDGEQGSRFLSDVAAIVSDPGITLLF